jgi:hypothetical protein
MPLPWKNQTTTTTTMMMQMRIHEVKMIPNDVLVEMC